MSGKLPMEKTIVLVNAVKVWRDTCFKRGTVVVLWDGAWWKIGYQDNSKAFAWYPKFIKSNSYLFTHSLTLCPWEAGHMLFLEWKGFPGFRTYSAKTRKFLANWDKLITLKPNEIVWLTEGKQQVSKQSQLWNQVQYNPVLAIMWDLKKQTDLAVPSSTSPSTTHTTAGTEDTGLSTHPQLSSEVPELLFPLMFQNPLNALSQGTKDHWTWFYAGSCGFYFGFCTDSGLTVVCLILSN